jgi:histidinol-phosphate aminotransferase
MNNKVIHFKITTPAFKKKSAFIKMFLSMLLIFFNAPDYNKKSLANNSIKQAGKPIVPLTSVLQNNTRNDHLKDKEFVIFLRNKYARWSNFRHAEEVSDKEFLKAYKEFHYLREIDTLYRHWIYLQESGEINHPENRKYFLSDAILSFPNLAKPNSSGTDQLRSAKVIRAVEKYMNDDALSSKEQYIINNLEKEWVFANFITPTYNRILDELQRDDLTSERRAYLFNITVGTGNTQATALHLDGLRNETEELVGNALQKRELEQVFLEQQRRKNLIGALMVISSLMLLSLSYILKRYLSDKKIFNEEEKKVINDFKNLRRKLVEDPAIISDLNPDELKVLHNVDNPNIGNIAEIQRKLKIIMSKYNEFHLSAIEKIKSGKYYQLIKRLDHKKYGGEGNVLQQELAKHYGLKTKNITVFDNGSSRGLSEIIKAYGKDKKIMVEVPTYGPIYDTAKLVTKAKGPGELVTYEHAQRSRNLHSLSKKIQTEKPSLVILCNPGNPFGQFTPAKELQEFGKKFPNTVFLIDEAYLDFYEVQNKELTDYQDLPGNMIFLRTFSKMHGLAGRRIGYAVSTPKHIKKIQSFPFMTFFQSEAEYAAAHAIDQYQKYTQKYIQPTLKNNLKIIEKYKNIFGKDNIFNPEAPNMVLLKLQDISQEQTTLLDYFLRSVGKLYINIFGEGASFDTNKIGFSEGTYLRISLLDKKTNEKVLQELLKALKALKLLK